MDNKICYIISHTHWDREWYLPYEKHHVRLIHLMDSLLDTLENNKEFSSFHLDGQTIILEDYLEIRPEMKEKLHQFIKEERIHIGPWYILQDEFLTSSEANIRNLQYGHQVARNFGAVSKIGYFPDSFGNMGQAAQILKQAGIKTAVFGRGVKPTGFNNQITSSDQFESPYSEIMWKSPDGSSVLGILFANWYNNGMEIPVDEEEARIYWDKRICDVEKFASTNHLLFMNGCDHQPIQRDLMSAIHTAKKMYPHIEFKHSNFNDYIENLNQSLPSDLKIIEGELRSQHTNGWGTLVNTASSRIYLKQMNQQGQTLLEKVAEPLAAFAAIFGMSYPDHLLTYAWKTLLQNHPHDSICGCSIDEVHREMIVRFDKSRFVAEEIIEESLDFVGGNIDTSVFEVFGTNVVPFILFNTTGWEKSSVVSVELDIEKFPFEKESTPKNAANKARDVLIDDYDLIDCDGNSVAFELEDMGAQFGYTLPKNRFRQPFMTRRVKLMFEAENVPALGYQGFAFLKRKISINHGCSQSMIINPRKMENKHLVVEFSMDGSFTITEKQSGHKYRDLCMYENSGDIGNEYMYMKPIKEIPLTTKGLEAKIEVFEDTPQKATFKVTHEWNLPQCADDLLKKEINDMIPYYERKSGRTKDTVLFLINTFVQIEKNSRSIKVKTSFVNNAKDHRLRVLFPTDLEAKVHEADSIFEVAKREIKPAAEWENPSHCQHQQAFVSLNDGFYGLTIANKGLNEYEVLQDGRNTIAITVLRAVSELGDWGVFLTPEAQCQGLQTVEFMIIPHTGNGIQSGAFREAYQYQIPFQAKSLEIQQGCLPIKYGLVKWDHPSLAFSSMKLNDCSNDLMLRWFNMEKGGTTFTFIPQFEVNEVYQSNILEERLEQIDISNNQKTPIKPAEIFTIGIKYGL